MRRCVAWALGLAVLAGCAGEARVDGETVSAFVDSLQAVRAAAPDPEAVRDAVRLLAAEEAARSPGDPDAAFQRLRDRLDGMTAAEIVAEAATVRLSPGEARALDRAGGAADRIGGGRD